DALPSCGALDLGGRGAARDVGENHLVDIEFGVGERLEDRFAAVDGEEPVLRRHCGWVRHGRESSTPRPGRLCQDRPMLDRLSALDASFLNGRSEEHTSELQSRENLVCRLLL